ncbi:olfactory receptor 8G17-like [Anomaloglossus baeobatrachus]|uniref:olfactory receptor 8G17-like n=1 Tax=Anomaloglossus baeobatrachus TaxID=238106 RepID=UPI003F50988C
MKKMEKFGSMYWGMLVRFPQTDKMEKMEKFCSTHWGMLVLFLWTHRIEKMEKFGSMYWGIIAPFPQTHRIDSIEITPAFIHLVADLSSCDNSTLSMNPPNQTMVTYFIIKGISGVPELQLPIFLLFFFIYMLILGGNMTIIMVSCLDHHLHTPMYFFLGNLSMVDISCSTVSLHKIFANIILGDKSVSYLACMVQMHFFASFTFDEFAILAVMSYDRYIAVCNPLLYHTVMTQKVCVWLAVISWISGFFIVLSPIILISNFSCYRSHEINHFFCDLVPLMEITCDDIATLQIVIFTDGISLFGLLPFLLTFTPYIFIIIAILKIRTGTGRRKAFYTCSSHLTVVILLYLIISLQYFNPNSKRSTESSKLFSMFNTVFIPIVNPFIYSFKNKDMTLAIKKLCYFVLFSSSI